MAKKDRIFVALGESFEKWNEYLLKNYGLPEVPQPRYEDTETAACVTDDRRREPLEAVASRQINLGEEPPTGLLKVWAEYSGLENEPSERWRHSQAFMRVMACVFACQNKLTEPERAELLKHVDDLRPINPLPVFDESWGTPEEFLDRWRCHELDVRFVCKNRGTQMFEVWRESIPPDEPDDWDESEAPRGHWDGLKWTPDTGISGS